MKISKIKELGTEYLVPFFPGSKILPKLDRPKCVRPGLVASITVCTLALKLKPAGTTRIQLFRSHPFAAASARGIPEKKVAEAFLEVLRSVEPALDQEFERDLFTTFHRQVVPRAVGGKLMYQQVLGVLDHLGSLASRSYEGARITAAFGFDPHEKSAGIPFSDTRSEEFILVLSNGYDTLLKLKEAGELVGHRSLLAPKVECSYAPHRLGKLAAWTQKGRFVLVLNQQGDIIALKDRQVVFTRRSGTWYSITPGAFLSQLGRPNDNAIRKAILESALDVSFAKSGGCLGIMISGREGKLKDVLKIKSDRVDGGTSLKAQITRRLIAGKKFHELDRRLRQELLAIDGATIIDHEGTILEAGAIVSIPGGSSAGGRKAAAIAVSKLGLGIKISQDGGVTVFQDGSAEPKMKLM